MREVLGQGENVGDSGKIIGAFGSLFSGLNKKCVKEDSSICPDTLIFLGLIILLRFFFMLAGDSQMHATSEKVVYNYDCIILITGRLNYINYSHDFYWYFPVNIVNS